MISPNRNKILLSIFFIIFSMFTLSSGIAGWGFPHVPLAAAQEISDAHVAEIDAINQAIREKEGQWIAGETSLTPLPLAERQRRVGLLYPLGQEEEGIPALQDQRILALPSSLDWRSNRGNFVTPIRDQGQCGSCWAFATTAAAESAVIITLDAPGTDLNLAEQILVSCSGQGSCGGGYIHSTSTYIRDAGLPLESCYPYTATNGNCSDACANWPSSTYKITGWSSVSQSVDLIKNALYTYGPLVTTMDVYQDFFNYRSGIYSYASGSYAGGHAILLIGYDDGGQYFTCKNSWGTWWGESGYFRIAYSQLSSVVRFGAYTIAYWDGVSPNSETVSAPSTPSGSASGTTGSSYSYTTSGSASSLGHSVQYLFDWGDGTNSGWLGVGTTSTSKSWPSSGAYSVKAQARCASDPTVVSGMSGSLTVTISPPPETVSAPTVLSGQTSGTAGVSYTYTTGGSSSSNGHSVQYFFDWGDGLNSGWLSVGTTTASKSWSSSGTYPVKTQARCSTHNAVSSSWTNPLSVVINASTPGTLSVTPSGGLSASGNQGGPFSPASQVYTLQNGGGTALNWTASKAQNWVSLSSTSGTLAAGASTTVAVSINSNANGLNPGNYSDTVTFKNTTNGNGTTTRPVALAINVPVLTYTIQTNPPGLQVVVDTAAYTAPRSFNWPVGSSHSLSVASPQSLVAGTRHPFSSWSDGGSQAHTITASSGTTTYTAFFSTQYSLTTSVNIPEGGTVSPFGTNWYNSGETVTVSATPNPGYGFSSWSGDLSGTVNPGFVTLINGPKSVTANFGAISNAQVVVLTPNGGEIMPSGSNQEVRWDGPSQAVKFRLFFSMNNGATWKRMTENDVTDKAYGWIVPKPGKTRKECLVKVVGYDRTGKVVGSDRSDKPFTIEVVRVTSPHPGGALSAGATHAITWTAHETVNPVASIKLYFSRDGGTTWRRIGTLPAGSFGYDWTVPDVQSNRCKVKVVLTDEKGKPVGVDATDGFFLIHSSIPQ